MDLRGEVAMHRLWVPPRVDREEWLDTQHGPTSDAIRSLQDLHRIYRWLGGRAVYRATLMRTLKRWPRGRPVAVLDVAAGGGDVLHDLARYARRRGLTVRFLHLDRNELHLHWARSRWTRCPAPCFVQADALRLPFRADSIDFVISGLFLHHVWDRAEELVRELLRVARYAVVINDLLRHRLPLWFLRGLGPLFMRSPITRHDGPVSVLRALSLAELRALTRRIPAYSQRVYLHWTFRYGWMIWKRSLPTS